MERATNSTAPVSGLKADEGPSILRPGALGAGPQVGVSEVGLAGVSFSLSSMEGSTEDK